MVLYIVRHGETDWNVEHRYLGSTDLPLNERGLEQAAVLADRFRDISLAAVYASDLTRSYQTAEIIGRLHGLQVSVLPELREISFGDWEGLSESEIAERYGADLYRKWKEDPGVIPIPRGESLEKLLARSLAGIEKIKARHFKERTLLVTHGGNMMALGCHFNDEPLSRFWDYFPGNSAVYTLTMKDDELTLVPGLEE